MNTMEFLLTSKNGVTLAIATKTRISTDRPSYLDDAGNVDIEKAETALDSVVKRMEGGSLDPDNGKEALERICEDLRVQRIREECKVDQVRKRRGDDHPSLGPIRKALRSVVVLLNKAKVLLERIRDKGGFGESALARA